jgi:hypothetical protein
MVGGCELYSSEQNRGQWQALVNTVMDLRVPEKVEN